MATCSTVRSSGSWIAVLAALLCVSASWTSAALGTPGDRRHDHVNALEAQPGEGTAGVAGARGSELRSGSVVMPSDPMPNPFSLWSIDSVGGDQDPDDGAVEVGVRFRSSVPGAVTGVRFYKHPGNAGVHVGSLWTAAGVRLATATFAAEGASGWQEVAFESPVFVSAESAYVASVFMPQGRYASTQRYFESSGRDRAPLYAFRDGEGGPNGVFRYGPAGGFPSQSHLSSNYWVDVVFDTTLTPDTTPPAILSTVPADGALGAGYAVRASAVVSEPLRAATVNASTVELRDASNAIVPATVSWDRRERTITLVPAVLLAPATAYTVTLRGGATPRIEDLAGNPLPATVAWTFTTAPAPPAPPDEGPGGPILVVAWSANPFSRYYGEILRAEGLNAFSITDISRVTPAVLALHDVVILGEMPLTAAQAALFEDWVNGGGNLIAMRPAPALSGLLGLTAAGGTLLDRYLLLDTSRAPAAGLVAETIQYHGVADLYTTSFAEVLAQLYSDAATPTTHPAVTLRDIGSQGGQAAAFAYDLARSIVLTRQGNPAWAGQERDGIAPRRSNDLFFGGATFDPQPDWIDLAKVAIPQADEQQRLLAQLVLHVNRDRKPLPRFWYLPRGLKAAVVMTGDNHGAGGMAPRFDIYRAQSPAGCAAGDWSCVRATGYLYPGAEFTDAQAAFYASLGFEIAAHVNTGCADWTEASLRAALESELAAFAAAYPSVPSPITNRTHCIAWSDWATQPKVQSEFGIRFDTNYYYWPDTWVQSRPGMFTGSGLPMRFADLDGTTIDCYQAATQMTDESGQAYPFTIDRLLDRALGPEGYYGAFVANMHFDRSPDPGSDAIVASALARGVPVVSARQMLEWLDGRNASSFGAITWNAGTLLFTVATGAGANGLRAMLPYVVEGGELESLRLDGTPVAWTVETIKGVTYATFPAEPGRYSANYERDITPPAIADVAATPGADGTSVTLTWTTDEPADSYARFGVQAGWLVDLPALPALVTAHSVTIQGLAPGTTYHFRVESNDAALNRSTWPVEPAPPATFTTPTTPCAYDRSSSDFAAGTLAATAVAAGDAGQVILAPAGDWDMAGPVAPLGWNSSPWSGGGGTEFVDGAARIDGALLGPGTSFGPGATLEFVATFGAEAFQHIGFSDDFASTWMIFSTGGTSYTLYARTSPDIETPIPGAWIGMPHRFRVQRTATEVVYSIDGVVVATHAFSGPAPLRPVASDYSVGGRALTLKCMRLLPYADSGSFTSRVFDAGEVVQWTTAGWTATTPAGTSVALWVRRGDTPEPDSTWTGFEPLPAQGSPIGGPSRYLQYRAELTTTDLQVTPALHDVAFRCLGSTSYVIQAAAGLGGTITPAGAIEVAPGGSQEFVIAPDGANHIVDVLVDGVSVGAVTRHTFTGVSANHTIVALFAEPGPLAVDGMRVELGLSPAWPNPAAGRTRVAFGLPLASRVRVVVLDLQGREVEELANGDFPAGRHELTWRPRRDGGPVGAGVYFIRCEAGGRTFTRRVVMTF